MLVHIPKIMQTLLWQFTILWVDLLPHTFVYQCKEILTMFGTWQVHTLTIINDFYERSYWLILRWIKSIENRHVVSQIIPIHDKVQQIPGRKSKATKELLFRAVNLPPLGYKRYEINANPDTEEIITERTGSLGGDVSQKTKRNIHVCVGHFFFFFFY